MAGRIAYYGGIVTNGLVLALDAAKKDSYPGSGTVWRDISGNGNNGTLTNGPTFNSANGGSIVFDGVNDYCRVLYSWSLYNTIIFWIYPISTPTSPSFAAFRIISSGANDAFEIGMDSIFRISYFFRASGGWRPYVTELSSGTWTSLSFVNDGSMSIYKNGILTYTGTAANATSGVNVNIGGRYNNSEYSNIQISQTQIYNRALSAAEVLQNYNATKGRFGL